MTELTYDPVGNLTSVTDALENKTDFIYDKAGRLTTVTYLTALPSGIPMT